MLYLEWNENVLAEKPKKDKVSRSNGVDCTLLNDEEEKNPLALLASHSFDTPLKKPK